MAKKINSRDLFEKEDIFEGIRLSAQKTLEELNKVDQQFKQIAQSMRTALGSTQTNTTAGIQAFTKATEDANKAVENSIQIEKLKAQATQQALKAEQEREKVAQQKLRTQSAQAKEQERLNKIQERSAQTARNEANAYKQLEKNTRALKNESKQLGAEMLALERAGKKNTAAYRELEQRYKTVTSAAQKGDGQLKKLDKTVGDNFRNVGNYQSALGKLNGVLGAVGLGFGLNVALRQTKQLITDSIDAFRIQEKAVKQVETGLASTNNKVGLSLQNLKDEASALQKQTLFGDEAILKDVTSILLTFTNIQGETFKSAQKNVLDLATRMDGDLKGASVQLGKALNDPIKGITALTKVGVSFTAQQKEQVKTLVESGQLQEAQALILKELNTEFGGSAEAAAKADGGFTQLQNSIGDAKELIGSLIVERLKPLNKTLLEFFSNLTQEDIKSFVNTMATLGSIIFKVTTAYVTYKGVLMALNVIERLRNTNFKDLGNQMLKQIPLTKQYAQAQKEAAQAQQQGASATKGFGSALAGVGWTVAIGVAIELATALYDVASGAKAAREQQAILDAYNAEAEKKAGKRVSERQKDLQKEIAELQRKRNENKLTEKEFLKLKEDAVKKTKDEIQNDIKKVKTRDEGYKKDLAQLKEINKNVKDEVNLRENLKKQQELTRKIAEKYKIEGDESWVTLFSGEKDAAGIDNVIQSLQGKITATGKKLEIYKDELDGTTESVKDATSELKANGVAQEDNTGKINAKIPKQKAINTEFKKTNDYLSKQTELLEQLNKIEDERAINALEQQIESEVDLQESKVKETGQFDLTEFKKLVEEKYRLEVNRILDTADFEQQTNEDKYQREKQARIEALDEEYAELRNGAEGNQAALKTIDQNYANEKQKLADNEVLIYEDLKAQNLIIAKESTDEVNELEKSKLDFVKSTNENILNEQKTFNEKKTENNEKQSESELDKLKETEEQKREIIKITSEFFQKQSEKRIEQYDKEIAAAERQYEILKGLADSGNINASESLAEQQKIIDEANRKKAQEQQRQQRIKLAESVYSTYSQKVEAGSKNPLAETIRDTTLLQQFINSLPAFMDGTEDTGTNGRGIDGKGGFQAVLHPNERVIPKHLNEQIGAISNVDLARIAQEYNNGKIVEGGNQTRSALEFAVLVNELKDLKSVIQDKPETNIELGQITNSVMEIVQSRKQGNSVTYNRFKVRK